MSYLRTIELVARMRVLVRLLKDRVAAAEVGPALATKFWMFEGVTPGIE
eukprot:CAMPEP_0185005746 /NCGR_PEP_ID=MMETSP1098-20130426/82698_1 /TAXON_ID=89044 /ORGANISM="Spumella elongata, Strain CCAP 955/1" /LENGTH=48 /DNA_ID= /DNA_START= /DNA_END= /DNA_ORIENTATION=